MEKIVAPFDSSRKTSLCNNCWSCSQSFVPLYAGTRENYSPGPPWSWMWPSNLGNVLTYGEWTEPCISSLLIQITHRLSSQTMATIEKAGKQPWTAAQTHKAFWVREQAICIALRHWDLFVVSTVWSNLSCYHKPIDSLFSCQRGLPRFLTLFWPRGSVWKSAWGLLGGVSLLLKRIT